MNLNSWQISVGVIRRVRKGATPFLRLYLPDANHDLDADVARDLARELKRYADFADPPKPRGSR